MDTSPAQSLLGRRGKTLLPTTETLLTPGFSLVNDANTLRVRKELQYKYYNRRKRTISPVNPGETIRVRSPDGTWKQAECLREVAPRSYEVLIDGQVRRRNHKDIRRTSEPQTARDFDECEPVHMSTCSSPFSWQTSPSMKNHSAYNIQIFQGTYLFT